jgi:hypothetical protein
MVFSYVRVRRPLEDAMARYGRWVAEPELEAPRVVRERDAIDLSLENGNWRGMAVYIYASDGWTVFEDMTGALASRTVADWLKLADGGDLVFAGYNDAIPYAEVLVIENGQLIRRYLQDEQDPSEDADVGRLPEEADEPFADWIAAMGWVEEDQDRLDRKDQGWLWIHRYIWPE